MKLTNSLTRQLADFEEVLGKKPGDTITMYSCGPTVYDHAHIGNLRSFIMDDLLRRTITASGYKLKAIMNITDVDDKMITRSQEKYPELAKENPNEALRKLADEYTAAFLEDIKAVGVDASLFEIVKATDSIPAMQEMIVQIFKNGFAYESEGSIYFDVAKYREHHEYGRLVNIDFSHQQSRVDNDEYEKAEAQDFVLWKGHKDGEPSWEFNFDSKELPGRPGWHIECSAMSAALGLPFDIHTGGIDLKFPHHENEIAQSTAASGNEMAKIFVHWNHLFVDGKKMSKSLNNFYKLEDITAKGYDPLVYRMLVLQAHYSSELNFTWESVEGAKNRLTGWTDWATSRFQSVENHQPDAHVHIKAMAHDLKSIDFLTVIDSYTLPPSNEFLKTIDDMCGLSLTATSDISDSEKSLLADRQQAREAKDWAKSDEIRDELLKSDIEISDTPNGPRWRRTN